MFRLMCGVLVLLVSGFANQAKADERAGAFAELRAGLINGDSEALTYNGNAFALVGGWRFGEYWAVEGGYLRANALDPAAAGCGGSPDPVVCEFPSVRVGEASFDGYTVGVRGWLPVGERWGFTGRVGALSWDFDLDDFFGPRSSDGVDPYFGVGVTWIVHRGFQVDLAIDRYAVDEAHFVAGSIVLGWHFGG